MKLIYVASPFSGDVEKNIEYAREACRAVMNCGHAFFAPHLLYPSFLDDTVPEERKRGMDMGLKALARCDELWAFGPELSAGMRTEMKEAKRLNIPVRRVELTEELTVQEPDPCVKTVEQFLREYPDCTLDLITPYGYVTITPEQGRELLNGGQFYAHPGAPEYGMKMDAEEILCQEFETLLQDEKDPKLYNGFTYYPDQTESEGETFSGMMSPC